MRPKILAGNWKMFKDLRETSELLTGIVSGLGTLRAGVEVIVCPPYTSLSLAGEMLRNTRVRLGAQNMSEFDEGAYTGEISWKMLRSAGCEHVILGHSERRQYFHESDELVNRKAKKALSVGLRPIICVGETLQQREGGTTARVVEAQVRGVLSGLTGELLANVIIAYEPVWAIGTGKNATPAEAEEVHVLIRSLVGELFGARSADSIVIQYGGSVKPDNSAELLRQPDIDGALIGGACLKADSFLAIVRSAQ
jgi:triosephosphate isomerase